MLVPLRKLSMLAGLSTALLIGGVIVSSSASAATATPAAHQAPAAAAASEVLSVPAAHATITLTAAALASGNLRQVHSSQRLPAQGLFTRGATEIVVSGDASQVATVSYREYTALSFTAQGLTVTVLSRHPLPPSPRFDLVTDLEPFFEGYVRGTQEWLRRLYRQPAAAGPR